jgi:hypothetical protein
MNKEELIGKKFNLDLGSSAPVSMIVKDVTKDKVIVEYLDSTPGRTEEFTISEFEYFAMIKLESVFIDNKYIIDGINIVKTKEGYRVFTIPTQHFNIVDLDELTNDRFDLEIKRQKQYEKESSELINLYLSENE